ncbi:VIT1/CCC1 transporter family protein [Propionibacteriaceae bacterium G1746]|uniref:VIT1/CCC1 transporter family protein n=1 Tax=Aestuariimicrobium sp. G57 TaxID=3418485 RepID=UPI003C2895B8
MSLAADQPVVDEEAVRTSVPDELGPRLNRLRAGVLGANDGIVSTAAVVVGVASAQASTEVIAMAGLAAAVGGAISMALGEYVSVSSQADTEKQHGVKPEHVVSAWQAALTSFLSFSLGAALPLLAILLTPESARIAVTAVATLIGLALTGGIAANIGGAPKVPAMLRTVIGGTLALAATYVVGMLFNTGP